MVFHPISPFIEDYISFSLNMFGPNYFSYYLFFLIFKCSSSCSVNLLDTYSLMVILCIIFIFDFSISVQCIVSYFSSSSSKLSLFSLNSLNCFLHRKLKSTAASDPLLLYFLDLAWPPEHAVIDLPFPPICLSAVCADFY